MFNPTRGEPRCLIPIHERSPGNPTSGSSRVEGRSHGSEYMGPSARDPIPLNELLTGRRDTLDRLMLSDAIERLAQVEPRMARVVDCRFFGGMSDEDIAEALEVTTRTVQRDWAKARMLLRRALAP